MNVNPSPRVLFVCTGNAGRSQMAEAMFKASAPEPNAICSAGVEPWPDLHPMARKLMAERGLDLAGHYPKPVRPFIDREWDVVVTIGDRAAAETPDFRTGVRRIHWDLRDPAEADGTPDSEAVFRETCRQIADRLSALRQTLARQPCRSAMVRRPAVSSILTRPVPFDPEVHLPAFAAEGLTAIELTYYSEPQDFPWETPGAVKRLKRVAGDLGIVIASLHPPDRGLLHADSRAIQMDVLKRSVDLAEELGAATLSCHAGFRLPRDSTRESALALLDQSLDELADYVAARPVVICLESLMGTPDCISNAAVVARVKARSASALGFVLDTGHAQIAGCLAGLPALAGRRLQNLHVHDNDGRQDLHGFPGTGVIDWPAFMRTLDENGYEGPLLLEVESRSLPLADSLRRCHEAFALLRSDPGGG